MKLPENIITALEILAGSGFEAFVVGGCVRDMLMGKTPADYDITTNALPHQTAECFKDYRVIETGIKHGTVTVVIDDENIEITTYRVDGEYVDNRRPENVSFTASITEDLARRDFTMNAICYSPEKGIIDPFEGRKDIERGIIRCVGEPDKRFNEDGLRILRAIRFASQTGFEIDEETNKSIRKNKNLVKNISEERIFVEFKKLLRGKNAHKVLSEYRDVIAVFIPEILPMIDFEQNTKYHYLDVYSHTLDALKNSQNSEIIRLAIFLHDIGKPNAFFADEDGTAHFKGHAKIGAEIARKILLRLKVDRFTTDTVTDLIEFHSEKITPDRVKLKRIISQKGFEFIRLLITLKRADASAKAPQFRNTTEIEEAEKLVYEIEEKKEPVFINDLAVTGNDMIELGLKGKSIGDMLEKLLIDVQSDENLNTREQLLKKAEGYLANENR